ncbi:MAG: chromosome segregation protein [Fimbriimonadaceae bacterium]|jgi:chromosome segregation protein|nr:chromosome segregation protein [Fimbriimonadaceae bacterium]
MRLKRVRIFGFKTFADRAEFDIDGGIVAVVGPNGCGKSNLVDAILWGLGEGSAKHIRAQSGQDVIFNGSSRRKPVGFAEVTLLFDNEDGSLPIDTPEVTVSRRITRSGDSEYSINRKSCRQRDVYELLADSGLGRSGYAIVGQKEIDQALAASPEDRRSWVDEAAGVQRYRTRKIESQRRLAAAQQHLQRVTDILRELEVQREPLRQEAEVAKRYRSVHDSLRAIEVGLLVKELSQAVKDVTENAAQIEKSQKIATDENKRADKAETRTHQIGNEAADLENQIEMLWSVQQRGLMAQERAEADLKLAAQRLSSLADHELALDQEASQIEQRLADAIAELEVLKAEVATEQQALERLRLECGGAGDEAKKLAAEAGAIEKELTKARELHARKMRLEAEAAHREDRVKLAKRELAGIDSGLPDLDAALQEALKVLEAATTKVQVARDNLQKVDKDLVELRREDDESAAETRKLLTERASLEGRIRGIEATIESHEGLAHGSRAVLEAVEKGALKGEYTPVGEAVETGKEHALAIETALGASVNDLIVKTDSEAKAAIAYLKENRAGRATFQPIPLMRPVEPTADLKKLLKESAVVGRASELVECQPEYRPVIESLLGRVLIVEDIDSALKLAKTHGWSRLVTLDGEVVHSAGGVTGGRTNKVGYGLVQRKADLAELNSTLQKLAKDVKKAEQAGEARSAKREKLDAQHKALLDQIKALSQEADEAKEFHSRLYDEHQSTVRSKARIEQDIATLTAQSKEEVEDVNVAEIETRRDEILRALAAKSSDAESAEERLRDAEGRLRQSQIRYEGGQRRVATANEAESHRKKRLTTLGPEREKLLRDITHFEKIRAKAQGDREDSEKRLETIKAKKHTLMEEAHRLGEESRQARANAVAVTDTIHRAELARARAESKRAAAVERLLEEYGISEEEGLAQEGQVEVPSDAAMLVGRLRKELKAMGPVNLGAIEAFDRLTERCDELTGQKDDIEGGIDQVRASIAEMDKLTRERFITTFEQVQVAFAELFTRLFSGGTGQLSLTDPSSVLESGIDIDVTLPGKKKQRLELLSGGERALCACAFLFALLKVKPSPLVVLDEVDAPLDGRNVERFVGLLRDFSEVTQFIVVTHNPTTIESSPVWLGVTMQEPGVSTLVPTRMAMGGAPAPVTRAVIQMPELAAIEA